ncbi:hypothetical protein Tco_1563999 [Tanacetum coccineum]
MANQEKNPPQQEQPFVAAKQVGFNLEYIIIYTNNEVALLYPEHNNKDHFKCVFDFISKCCLRKPFTRSPNMYKEYLVEFWYSTKALDNSNVSFSTPTGGIYGKVGVNTFRNAIGASIPPRLLRWSLKILKKKNKTSSKAESVSEVTKPEAKPGHKKLLTSKQPSVSSRDATKASFIIYFESASGCDASADSIAEADPGLSAPSTNPHVLANKTKSVSEGLETILTQPTIGKRASSIARQVEEEETSNTIKLENLGKLVSHVQPSFKDIDSPEDDPVIVVDDSDEDEETEKDEVHLTPNVETEDTSVPKSSSPRTKDKLKLLSLKLNPPFQNVEQLKEQLKQVHELEIELPGDLKEIPTKLDDFKKNVASLTSQVVKLKTLQWELPAEFLLLPAQVASVQAKLKTLDDLPSLLLNVTQALNKFTQVLDSALSKAGD